MVDTQDMGLAAALQLNGISPTHSHFERGRLVFRYDETPEFLCIREAYVSNRLQGPLNLYNTIIKSFVFQIKEGVQHGR